MTDSQPQVLDPEHVPIPVTGDCGHAFEVPLARLSDRNEFNCPVCGAVDNLDEAAVQATRDDVEKMVDDGTLGNLAGVVKAYLDQMVPRQA